MFAHDVEPEQKHHYLTNKYSTSGESAETKDESDDIGGNLDEASDKKKKRKKKKTDGISGRSDETGGISYVQGEKTKEKKQEQALPCLRVSILFICVLINRGKMNLCLYVRFLKDFGS